jgi:hypothetical protein
MRNQKIGVWAWQRLYKAVGSGDVLAELGPYEDHPSLHTDHQKMRRGGLFWLCPKPCLVLVGARLKETDETEKTMEFAE